MSQSDRQYILFTWSKCVNCVELKKKLQGYINRGVIKEVDLEAASNNQSLMNIFQSISPNNHVPAMIIVQNGRVTRSAINPREILILLGIN